MKTTIAILADLTWREYRKESDPFKGEDDLAIIVELGDRSSFLKSVLEERPDVVIMAAILQASRGSLPVPLLINKIRRNLVDTKTVLMASRPPEPELFVELYNEGLDAFFPEWHEIGKPSLPSLIRYVMSGENYYPSSVLKAVMKNYNHNSYTRVDGHFSPKTLTEHEQQVLLLYEKNYTVKEISKILNCSEPKIHKDTAQCRAKLGIDSTRGAIYKARTHDMLNDSLLIKLNLPDLDDDELRRHG